MKKYLGILSTFFMVFVMVISCSHYENEEIEDLSNDIVKDAPENLNKKEKEEIKEVIKRDNESMDMPVEEGMENITDLDDSENEFIPE